MSDFIDEYYADKDLSLLKKLTLVIPTHNRNYYLSRCLWYHAHFPFGQIIVADSSPEEKKIVNRETVTKIQKIFGSNILYLEYEPETEKYGGDIYRKWGDAVQHVETEFSQVCTDKAFKLPLAQIQAIEFLLNNNDYISATCGKRCSLVSRNDTLEFECSIESPTPDRVNDDPFVRFSKAISHSWTDSLLLEITRTEDLKSLYAYMIEFGVNDIRYGEYYLAYVGYLFGKYHFVENSVSSVRDVSNTSMDLVSQHTSRRGSSNSSTTRYPNVTNYEYLGTRQGFEYKSNYECVMKHLLSIQTNVSDNVINTYINDSLFPTLFTKYGYLPNSRLIVNVYTNLPIASKLYSAIPEIAKSAVKQLCCKQYRQPSKKDVVVPTTELHIISQICKNYGEHYLDDTPIL